MIRTRLWRGTARRIDYLNRQLGNFVKAPRYWTDDIRANIQVLSRTLTQNGLRESIFAGEHAGLPEERLALAQRLTLRFSRLLQAWPALTEAAADLKSRGIRLARRIS